MQDIDPQLRRLREIETRISIFETRIAELLGNLQKLALRGVDPHGLLESYEIRLQALETLRARRDALHRELEPSSAPGAIPATPRYGLLTSKPVRAHAMTVPELRRATLLFIDSTIESFERSNESPDAWESTHLARAIGFACAGMFYAAISHVEIALTHPENRGLYPAVPSQAAPVGLAWLRSMLDKLQVTARQTERGAEGEPASTPRD